MKRLTRYVLMMVMACCLAAGAGLLQSRVQASGPHPVVVMETSMGNVMVMLYPEKTPVTVENFLKYVDAGFYDGTVFHRVVKSEKDSRGRVTQNMDIVQGGGFVYPYRHKRPLPPIVNEAATGLSNTAGTISMARAADPNSATCEFFFNVEDNTAFDYAGGKGWGKSKATSNAGYCAFGKVIRGMDVLQKILNVETTRMGRMDDVPAKPVYINKAYRAK